MAGADGSVMPGKSMIQLVGLAGSGQNASLGGVSGSMFEIDQQSVTQGGGEASSKFSLQTVIEHGVGVGVGPGGGVGVGVPVGGVGEGPPIGAGPMISTMIGAPVLKKPIVAFDVVG